MRTEPELVLVVSEICTWEYGQFCAISSLLFHDKERRTSRVQEDAPAPGPLEPLLLRGQRGGQVVVARI